MPILLTAGEIKTITKGRVVGGTVSATARGVSIDSRSIKRRNVFIAIKGARLDGHRFVPAAIRKGAKVIVVSRNVVRPNGIAVIRVKDTTKALGQIAAWHRRQFPVPVIAVTGSAGKTTSKEMIAAVLAKRYRVLKNVKTENNQIGVPLTLLKLDASHQIAVLELGTNQPGDIRQLARIARPTTAVFTNIGDSHLARLRNREGVFREKIQLLKQLPAPGTVVLNGDDHFLRMLLKKNIQQKIISFGCRQKAGHRAGAISLTDNFHLRFKVHGHAFTVNSPALHNVYNALAAISCGVLHKIRYNEMKTALSRFSFRDARQAMIKHGRFWLIDDTYNANPLSLKSAITTLNALRVKGKKIVVCADMLELGRQSKVLHQSAGVMIAESAADVVLTVGPNARYIARGLNRANGGIRAVHCVDLKEVHQRLRRLCAAGDAVLVKGSRNMRMERTVAYLKKLSRERI